MVENNTVRVYCFWAVRANQASSWSAPKTRSSVPRTITEIGLFSTKRANTLPSMVASSRVSVSKACSVTNREREDHLNRAGLEAYGGDDGLTLARRSDIFGLLAIRHKATRTLVLCYVALACLWSTVYLLHRVINARFGMVLRGTKSNDMRMQALGFPTYRYRLTAFVMAGVLCGLAGALEANRAEFVSPAMMHWTRSGDLIVMVMLGGMGTLCGPVYGALAFLVLEELLSQLTEHWPVLFGGLLILIVLYARGGIDSLLGRRS